MEKGYKSWTISDELWEAVKDEIPQRKRDSKKTYQNKPGQGRPSLPARKVLEESSTFCAQDANGRQSPESMEVEAQSIEDFRNGRAWMGVWSKHHWHGSLWEKILQTEEKMGTKRSVLTDEKGLPLAIVLSGANTHDAKLLAQTLDGMVVFHPEPSDERPQNPCLDAGYTGHQNKVEVRGYAHIRPRVEEKKELEAKPDFRAHRWAVEVVHPFFNRFRKMLVRFEKKVDNYLTLIHFSCNIIIWRKMNHVHS